MLKCCVKVYLGGHSPESPALKSSQSARICVPAAAAAPHNTHQYPPSMVTNSALSISLTSKNFISKFCILILHYARNFVRVKKACEKINTTAGRSRHLLLFALQICHPNTINSNSSILSNIVIFYGKAQQCFAPFQAQLLPHPGAVVVYRGGADKKGCAYLRKGTTPRQQSQNFPLAGAEQLPGAISLLI